MHQSQREHIRQCLQRHARQHKHYRVVDVGSAKSQTGHSTHRDLFDGMDHEYLGVDVARRRERRCGDAPALPHPAAHQLRRHRAVRISF